METDKDKVYRMLLDSQDAISKSQTDIDKVNVNPHFIELTEKLECKMIFY